MTRSILVIDDNPVNRLLITELLEPAGFEIEEAASLVEARARLGRADLPGLLLVDMNLPDGHGLDLVRELRADQRSRTLPIAALTANAMKQDELAALASGCNLYLTKPFDGDSLLEAVDRLLADGEEA